MTPFDHCHVPLSLSVFELRGHRTRVIRQATLVPGIYASCPVPLLFQPGTINGKLYADGGIADRGAVFGLRPGNEPCPTICNPDRPGGDEAVRLSLFPSETGSAP